MDGAQQLEDVFSRSRLSLHVPADASRGSDDLHPPSRETIFYDEHLAVSCVLHLPSNLEWSAETIQRLLSSSGVSLSVEVGYVEEVGPHPRKQWANTGLGVSGPIELSQPLTPAPMPTIAAANEAYATAQPSPTSQVAFEQSRDTLRVEEKEGTFVASFDIVVDISYPTVPLASPMLVITATMSLRAQGLAGYLPASVGHHAEGAGQGASAKARAKRRLDADYAFVGAEEINLFSPLSAGATLLFELDRSSLPDRP
jgi:hypothetical protein